MQVTVLEIRNIMVSKTQTLSSIKKSISKLEFAVVWQ